MQRGQFNMQLLLLVRLELSVREGDLLPWLEGWHAEVGAAGTTKCITKVALQEEERVTTAIAGW